MAIQLHPLARAIMRAVPELDEAAAEVAARGVIEYVGRMPAVTAVRRDLRAIAKRDAALARSGIAASVVAMARELDYPWNSATSKSMCARAMREALDRLDEIAPAEEETDALDQLAAQRKQRIADRAGRAAAASPARP